jgi:hypothetical protein
MAADHVRPVDHHKDALTHQIDRSNQTLPEMATRVYHFAPRDRRHVGGRIASPGQTDPDLPPNHVGRLVAEIGAHYRFRSPLPKPGSRMLNLL